MTIWPPNRSDLKRPVYKSLADAAASAIEAEALKSGTRLPTHRDLAYDLGLSLHTVSRAYDELMRRGLIVARVGRGTFVRGKETDTRTPYVADSAQENLIDCSMLKPVCSDVQIEAMQAVLMDLGSELRSTVVTSFRPATALQPYRAAFLRWLEGCELKPHRDNVIITNGNTSAMTMALMTSAKHGDLIATEDLSHHTLRALAAYLGLKLRGLETDREGIVPDAFVNACTEGAVRALYVMPSGLGPKASMMSLERRQQLVEIAREFDVQIIENDAWGPLQPGRPAPIVSMAPERTFYFTGFSKCLMPGLRVACLVVPTVAIAAAANRHLVTSWIATPLLAEIAARWIEDGTAERLIEWQRTALGVRNAIAYNALKSLDFSASPNGLHVWLSLPEPWTEQSFVAQAHMNGVAVAPGTAFAVSDQPRQTGVRISLGNASLTGLERGLQVVSQLARSTPDAAALVS